MSVAMKALPAPAPKPAGRRRLHWLVGGAVVIGAILWFAAPEEPEVVEAVASDAAPVNATAAPAAAADSAAVAFARRAARKVGLDLFAQHSWYVPPPPPPPRVAGPPPKPVAPPLPYAFLGSYARTGDKPVYFLVRGDRVFDAHVGDVLEGTYRVEAVANGQLKLVYLPLQEEQALFVGGPQ